MSAGPHDSFAIIIPFKGVDNRLLECLSWCLSLDYPLGKTEIILLPDGDLSLSEIRKAMSSTILDGGRLEEITRIITTGPLLPGAKRNIGMANSSAANFACIDSDAYPETDWLKSALELIQHPEVGIVGGPSDMPKGISYFEKMSIQLWNLQCIHGRLYSLNKKKYGATLQTDMNSNNFIIRADVAKKCGYFDESIFPGEDSVLCARVLTQGYCILYSESVRVSHHRRPLFLPHLVSVIKYAESRIETFRRCPEQKRLVYFLPTLFLFFFSLGLISSLLDQALAIYFFLGLMFYSTIVLVDCLFCRIFNPIELIILNIGALLTHLAYGYGFSRAALRVMISFGR